MIELTAIDERQEHKGRSMLKDLLQQLQKAREEEEETRGLIEEMQRNLDEAHGTERKPGPDTLMKEEWSARTTSWTRCGTKRLNLDKDLEETMNKVKRAGWSETTKTKRF